jgi:transcriptional regulator with XRE-family HTH domain
LPRTITSSQVKEARALLGWSQEELAARAGISSVTIARFETASRNTRKTTIEMLRTTLEAHGVVFSIGKPKLKGGVSND